VWWPKGVLFVSMCGARVCILFDCVCFILLFMCLFYLFAHLCGNQGVLDSNDCVLCVWCVFIRVHVLSVCAVCLFVWVAGKFRTLMLWY